MNLKQINNNIRRVSTSGAAFIALVQATAVGIIQHAEQHGDCTPALRLVQAMPVSTRRDRLIRFFAAYFPIGMNVKDSKVALRKPKDRNYVAFDVAGATAANWAADPASEDSNEALPDTTLVDVQKLIGNLAKRIEKQIKDGRVAANDVGEVTQRLNALVSMGPVDEVVALRAELAALKAAA